MIKNLQISVHLALYSVPFTANTMVIFQILLECVKYDFLPVHEIIKFKFTETDPWNDRFAELGYDSSNFVEVLGSITIFILINVLRSVISAFCYYASINLKYKCCRRLFGPKNVKSGVLQFTVETYFELLLASLMVFGMAQVAVWRTSDKFAVTLQVMSFFWCVLYSIFLVWYICSPGSRIVKKRKEVVKGWYAN